MSTPTFLQPDFDAIETTNTNEETQEDNRVKELEGKVTELQSQLDLQTDKLAAYIKSVEATIAKLQSDRQELVDLLKDTNKQVAENTVKVNYAVIDGGTEAALVLTYLRSNPDMETTSFHAGVNKLGSRQTPPMSLSSKKIGDHMHNAGWKRSDKAIKNKYHYVRQNVTPVSSTYTPSPQASPSPQAPQFTQAPVQQYQQLPQASMYNQQQYQQTPQVSMYNQRQ